jgi:general secretion pathway protein D
MQNPFDPTKNDLIDPKGKLSRGDFESMRDLKSLQSGPSGVDADKKAVGVSEPPVPELAEILAAPRPPKIGESKLVSVAVTDDVPIKDVLIELARVADIDIEVDSGINGGISFRAKDRPFNEVVERIADLAGLRYSVKNNVLRVERDTPYMQVYTLDLLNIDRSASGNIGVNTAAGGGGGSGSGGASSSSSSSGGGAAASTNSINSGSRSNITASAAGDFWGKFEESIKQIIAFNPSSRASVPGIPVQTGASALPFDPAMPGGAPAPAPVAAPVQQSAGGSGSFYILNRQASTLTISATEKQHEIVKRFINKIQQNVASQVLIEAKIVEVRLNQLYQSGINWAKFGNSDINFTSTFNDVGATTGLSGPKIGPGNISFVSNSIFGTGTDLSAAVSLLDEFGTTRTISSPRLHAINNQQAVLNFTENLVYYELQIDVTDAVGGTTPTPGKTTIESTLKVLPVGVILSLQPSINTETNEVTINVRPSLSRQTGAVADPSVSFAIAKALENDDLSEEATTALLAIKNEIPVIEIREVDSILKIKSGQVMVIGGLMRDEITNTDSGVPGVAEVPWVGNLFKSVDKGKKLSELVIFIRATVVGPNGNATNADKALYEKFIEDPNPLKF